MHVNYWHRIFFGVLMVFFVGAWTLPIFPDPRDQVENVTFLEWLKRAAEHLYGEKTIPKSSKQESLSKKFTRTHSILSLVTAAPQSQINLYSVRRSLLLCFNS